MTKRTIAALLWLLAVWTTSNIVTLMLGLSSIIGAPFAALVAALVWWDPAGWFWPGKGDRVRVARRIADLPRVSETETAVATKPEADAAHG
jgi:hypothetical protein